LCNAIVEVKWRLEPREATRPADEMRLVVRARS
jgi:hypothetical protein